MARTTTHELRQNDNATIVGDSAWYKDAVIYELHIKSFLDSNNDGIGDIPGVLQKLDYLQELGVSALWLLPFYPSPLLDDGYDIADYYRINPDYGTLRDFKKLLREAHRRGIRIITELVINHTSDQHAWFQRARRAKPGSVHRDYYVWSDTPDKYREARIIFTDSESSNWTWDSVAGAYFWHRFYHHQPDLNFDNPRVRDEIFSVFDFWFGMGVDGMRLDAVPYLFERDDSNCENLPETHQFLKTLRSRLDAKYPDRILLAEANQWPEDAAAYFGDGDECHMCFHFPIMPRLFMALRMEDRFPVVDMLEQSLDIPAGCQWGMFLRNHDELTLEMVTDQERDYMYTAYAQDPRARINVGIRRRLSPLLDNNRRRIELLNSLLFSLPGTPILYYGDEIGMGDNIYLGDRDGVRTPMQWSPDRNAGFSQVNSQKLYLPVIADSEYHYATVNVENQSGNLSSLFWFMRRTIGARKQFKAFGRGDIRFLRSDTPSVLAFTRTYEEETLLVVANLSRHSQAVAIEMPDYAGYSVVDVFSDNVFPAITDLPYALTMAPHGFFWFALHEPAPGMIVDTEGAARIECDVTWPRIIGSRSEPLLIDAITDHLKQARWFGGKGRRIRAVRMGSSFTLSKEEQVFHVTRLEVTYAKGIRETYLLPLGFATHDAQIQLFREAPEGVLAYLTTSDGEGILHDAVYSEAFRELLLNHIAKRSTKRVPDGRVVGLRGTEFMRMLGADGPPARSNVFKADQSNTAILYGDKFFLKLYRRLEAGVNPDVELSRAITESTRFRNLPPYAGSIEWEDSAKRSTTIALLLQFVPNETDGWTYTLNNIERSYESALSYGEDHPAILDAPAPEDLYSIDVNHIPIEIQDFIGAQYLEMVKVLGVRTAQLHKSLASLTESKELEPEQFSLLYQKSLHQAIRGMVIKTLSELESARATLADRVAVAASDAVSEQVSDAVAQVLTRKNEILGKLRSVSSRKIPGMKTRTHGDFHLGQVLHNGKDFIVIDFEGEPARTISERRLKQSPLRDVAGMVRSFHYAAHGAVFLRGVRHGADYENLKNWAELWFVYTAGAFLSAYREAIGTDGIVPTDDSDFAVLLETFLLEKAVYEIGYELNNRPDWIMIPIHGVEAILNRGE